MIKKPQTYMKLKDQLSKMPNSMHERCVNTTYFHLVENHSYVKMVLLPFEFLCSCLDDLCNVLVEVKAHAL